MLRIVSNIWCDRLRLRIQAVRFRAVKEEDFKQVKICKNESSITELKSKMSFMKQEIMSMKKRRVNKKKDRRTE